MDESAHTHIASGEATNGDLTTPVVLITGGSSGIGREAALAYARRGNRLILVARDRDALETVAGDCLSEGATDAVAAPADIGDGAALHRVVDDVLVRWGRLDIAVLSAAITAFGRFEELPAETFDAVVTTNVLGTANSVRVVLPHFRARGGGHLVIIGSALGHAALPWQAPYVASKFALSALIRVLRQENDVPALLIHGIYPGPVDTPIYPNAANVTGRQARVPAPADDPATVARAIVAATDRRRPVDRSVGWVNGVMVLAYRLTPAVFDTLARPLLRLAGIFGRPRTVTDGNAGTGSVDQAASRPAGSPRRR